MSVVTTSRRWFTGGCLAHVVELGVAQLVLPAAQRKQHALGAPVVGLAACPVPVRRRVAVVPARSVPAASDHLVQSAPVLSRLLSAHTTHDNHGLRGSASTVLTVTGFVNGRGQFSTPHRIQTP